MSMRWPFRLARRRPFCRSTPSTTERMARLSAARVPAQRGALRVPLSWALALRVPCTRQPGGASTDHAPMLGRLACTLPLRGASGAHCQPPPLGVSWVLASAWAWPALALSQISWARTVLSVASSVSWAWRTPALVVGPSGTGTTGRGPPVKAVGPVLAPELVMTVGLGMSPVCTCTSPLVRASWACTRRLSPTSMSQLPPNTRLPVTPKLLAVVLPTLASAWAQAMGRPCSWPLLCRRWRGASAGPVRL